MLYSSKPLQLQGVRAFVFLITQSIQQVQFQKITSPRSSPNRFEIHVPINEFADNELIQNYVNPRDHIEFIVKIQPTEMREGLEQHVVHLDDVQQYVDGTSLRNENRLMRTFLEMATSQSALNQ